MGDLQAFGRVRDAVVTVVGLHQPEIPTEPIEQRPDQIDDARPLIAGAVRSSPRHGQEECILPDEPCKRAAGGTVSLTEARFPVISGASEDQRLPSSRIVVGVLVEHFVVADFEAVLPPHSVEDQVDGEAGRPLGTLAVEQERVPGKTGFLISAKRLENEQTHVRYGAENRRLPRGIGPEDTGSREHAHRRRTPRNCQLADHLRIGKSGPEQGESHLVPVRAHVPHRERKEGVRRTRRDRFDHYMCSIAENPRHSQERVSLAAER